MNVLPPDLVQHLPGCQMCCQTILQFAVVHQWEDQHSVQHEISLLASHLPEILMQFIFWSQQKHCTMFTFVLAVVKQKEPGQFELQKHPNCLILLLCVGCIGCGLAQKELAIFTVQNYRVKQQDGQIAFSEVAMIGHNAAS
jgi:hypothetical protein